MKTIKQLKGGSLSKTLVVKMNNKLYVRKLISIEHNREFGFYRWFSQYKKLQRYEKMFPNLFPSILNSGVNKDNYFFDIKYFDRGINCYELLLAENKLKNVKLIFNKIMINLKKINKYKYRSLPGGSQIFFSEEIKRRLIFFKKKLANDNFLKFKNYTINNKKIDNSINKIIKWLDKNHLDFNKVSECHTHGNLTLENILFDQKSKKIIFIDPYEENFIDCKHQEISQLLQSSNSHYEIMLDKKLKIVNNNLQIKYDVPVGISIFNNLLREYINSNFSKNEIKIIKFFEMAQFIRMLPFKIEHNPKKAKLFLIIALNIFNEEIDV